MISIRAFLAKLRSQEWRAYYREYALWWIDMYLEGVLNFVGIASLPFSLSFLAYLTYKIFMR